jgi:hypothetical protein
MLVILLVVIVLGSSETRLSSRREGRRRGRDSAPWMLEGGNIKAYLCGM